MLYSKLWEKIELVINCSFGVWIICSIFLVPQGYCETPEETHSDSAYDAFCDEKLFYKPYVRIKSPGRHGEMIKDSGPGFIELTSDMEDLYVCANGLVFFYFRIVQSIGRVYDDAVMQYASHYCGFFNGKPGPGIEERTVTLYAILLVGNANDYRKISIQLFTAPWFNKTSHTTTNFTSLAIINTGGECILQRGKANIRIKANPAIPVKKDEDGNETDPGPTSPDDEPFITICRLDVNILLRNPDNAPLDTELTTTEEALLALKLSDTRELRLRGCYEYPLIDPVQLAIVKDRLDESKEKENRIDQSNSELNPEDGSALKFWTTERLETYGSPVKEMDNSTLESLQKDVDNTTAAYNEEHAKPQNSRDKEKLKADKEAMEVATFKLKLYEIFKGYKELYDSAKDYGEKAESLWTEVYSAMNDTSVQDIVSSYRKAGTKLAELAHEILFSPYGKELETQREKIQMKQVELKAALRKKTFQIAPKITRAEILSARAKTFLKLATKKMERIQMIIKSFEKHKEVPKKLLDVVADEPPMVADMVISIKNPENVTSPLRDPLPCLTFPRRADQCKTAKPSAETSCHIAMNSIGGGDEGEWPGGVANQWRDEVLDLMTKIFSKVCTHLDRDFAENINRIVRGYLMRIPDGISNSVNNFVPGAPYIEPILQSYMRNYKIETEKDAVPDLKPKDPAIWDPVIEGLKQCETNVKPLEFEFVGMRPITVTFKGEQILVNVEQADREFAFNWVVDTNFKIFATVMGACFKELGKAQVQQFYNGYSTDFLDPIRSIWLSNRDNSVFKVALGRFMMSGKGDMWTNYCLESSYIRSGKEEMRPLRRLLVNGYTEPNFFTDGPLEGTRGEYGINL